MRWPRHLCRTGSLRISDLTRITHFKGTHGAASSPRSRDLQSGAAKTNWAKREKEANERRTKRTQNEEPKRRQEEGRNETFALHK